MASKDSSSEEQEPQGNEGGTENRELRELGFLLDVPLQVSVELGRSRVLIKDLLQMREGSVVELDKLAGEPLEVYVNSHLIARGEAVVVDDKIGLRLTDVVSPSERLEKLK
ncbi:MAG: flagellar motor switch protein FliN [Desulfohalobiaceae bacterium]|nr:flagellar motor switch protein FliN [Desulfohalobiaceae bacterium]MCF8085598.1 flagellar motor switch protein FliN [Desulfohalobiaceae bacterium]